MNPEWEPEFLTREVVDAIHEEQINAFGGFMVCGMKTP